jgi:phosphate transport system permease protein
VRRTRLLERAFSLVALAAIVLPLLVLAILMVEVVTSGFDRLTLSFLTSPPSRKPELAGLLPALAGSIYLLALTALIALPVGVGAAVYLEEYRQDSFWMRLVETNIANLAGVPSVIYGLLGLGVFVRTLGMGRSLIAGACTLALLVLPIVILASREALRAVPGHLREASLALGVTRWKTIRHVVLPAALPGILTGAILAISRAVGETAPLVVVGALSYVTFVPDGLDAPFSAIPIQIFNWVSRPQPGFAKNASAAIVVLLVVLLTMNGVAVFLRHRFGGDEGRR